MSVDDNEQQPTDSFHGTLTDVTNPKDQFSEIITNITKTLHMNTPEPTLNGIDIDDTNEDYDENECIPSKHQDLIEQLEAQLVHSQIQRRQPRNYLQILSQSNTPAYWFKTPSRSRSVYFYDPNYQKYLQQRSNSNSPSHQSIRLQEPSVTSLTPHNTTVNHHSTSRQYLSPSSRLQSVPTLPSIKISNQQNNRILSMNEKQINTKSKKIFYQIVMPPASE